MRLRLRTALPTTCAVVAAALTSWPAASPGRVTVDPGQLPQTATLPSSTSWRFRERMAALWRGIVRDSLPAALPAFFPRAAYIQVKQLPDAAADYRDRLLANFRADIHAAHLLVIHAGRAPRLVAVRVPRAWSWIQPGYCYNKIGYWHAPGARLVYRQRQRTFSFGIYSLISWRGEWYVVHLSTWNQPGTVDNPSTGTGTYGPPGGC